MRTVVKHLFLSLAAVMAVPSLGAKPTERDMKEAQSLKQKYLPLINSMKSVNMVGIGGCDAETGSGKDVDYDDFVPCLDVGFEDKKALANAIKTFRPPFQLQGFWVNFSYVGPITAQPGVTVHN